MRRSHFGIQIVFADEDERQFPDDGEIERFVKDALIDRAFAKKCERDAVLLLHLRGQRRARRMRNPRRDNRVRAQQARPMGR